MIERNVTIFKAQGEALEKYADRNVKVLVVANPANTNCWVAMHYAPSIPRENFSALTRLDHERLRSFLLQRVNDENRKKGVRLVFFWPILLSACYPSESSLTACVMFQ